MFMLFFVFWSGVFFAAGFEGDGGFLAWMAGFEGVVWGCAIVAGRCPILEGAVIAVGFWGLEVGTLERFFAVKGSGFAAVMFFFGVAGFAGMTAFGFTGVTILAGVDAVLFVILGTVAGLYFILGVVELEDAVATLGRVGVLGVVGMDLTGTVLLAVGNFLFGAPTELLAVRMGAFIFWTCVVSGRLKALCTDGFIAAMYCCIRFLCAADGVIFACIAWRLATDGILEFEVPFAFSNLRGFFVDASSRTRESCCCCCVASPIILSKSSGFCPL